MPTMPGACNLQWAAFEASGLSNGKGTCFEHPCALVTVKGDGSAGKAFVSMRNFEETKCKCS
eukprot:732728-Pelagomonas_calceolata.AAC.3